MSEFKIGDNVICVDASLSDGYLNVKDVYVIEKYYDSTRNVKLNGIDINFISSRFIFY